MDNWTSVIDRYQQAMRAGGYPKGTVYLRGYHLRRFATTVEVDVGQVTRDQIVAFLDVPQWALSYRHSFRVTLRGFFHWAKTEHIIRHNPTKHLKAVSAPTGKPRPAPADAVAQGESCTDRRVRTMVRLGAHAGLRCCEICRVHHDDVEQGIDGWTLRVLGKGRKTRIIPITDTLAGEIRQADEWLFPGLIDGHLSASYVSKIVSRALPQGWTAHTLRHRFASQAYIGSGKDIRAVQELLGHASVATTQIYTAVENSTLRAAVEYAA